MARLKKAYTLVELFILLSIVAALTVIAVPRLKLDTLYRIKADTVARKVVADLMLTRALAINNSATNVDGFAMNMLGSSPYTGYEIVNLDTSEVVDTYTVDSLISLTGGTPFQFGPLGNLLDGSATQLNVSSQGKTFTITVISATGGVKCQLN
ncbi:MAG: hypothetical protein JSV82_00240 [Planctomycetota bacterium]|nr:MAG: hypothetical protein JSV82_00240 [Planctomycetota bacterium]